MYLNHRALLQCTHGGHVMLFPPPLRSFNVMQSPVLTDMDLLRAIIIGCPQVGIGIKPCTKVVMIIVGRAVEIHVDGETPLLDSLQALTDGMPPGEVTAVTNGESNSTPAPHSFQADNLRNAAAAGAPFCQVCKGPEAQNNEGQAFVPREKPKGIQFEGPIWRKLMDKEGPPKPMDAFKIHETREGEKSPNRFGDGSYWATSARSITAETRKYLPEPGKDKYNLLNEKGEIHSDKFHVYTTDIKLQNVLDLTDKKTLDALGVERAYLLRENDYELTQQIGKWARENKYKGILAPSEPTGGRANNLVIFPEGLDSLSGRDSGGRASGHPRECIATVSKLALPSN